MSPVRPSYCASPARRVVEAVSRFFFEPASAAPLAALRVGVAGALLLQGLSLAADVSALYGPAGVVGWDVLDPPDLSHATTAIHPLAPRLRTLAGLAAPLGVGGEAAAKSVFVFHLAALAALLVGWRTRVSAAAAWLAHLALNNAAPATVYGVDFLANIALFYCVAFSVGAEFSIDAGRRPASGPTPANRLALRVLQLHLCVIYFVSAVEKAAGPQWWDGTAVWRAHTLPEFEVFDMTWLASVPWLCVLAGWATLAVEGGYAFLVWHRRTRPAIAAATIGLHAGIGLFMNMPFFAALMIALTAAAFVAPAEPAAERMWFLRLDRLADRIKRTSRPSLARAVSARRAA